MSVTIRDYLRRLRIDYLQTPTARAFWEPLAAAADRVVQRFVFVARQGTVMQCADDMLDRHARNRNDKRAPRESSAALRAYLSGPVWDAKKGAGTKEGLIRQLRRIPTVTTVEVVREIDLRKAGIVGAFGGYNFFFIVIRPPHPWYGSAPRWGDGGEWDDGRVWGGNLITADELQDLRRLIRAWKPDGHSCRFIIFADTTFTYDGTGLHGKYKLYHCWESWEDDEGSSARTPFYNNSYLTP